MTVTLLSKSYVFSMGRRYGLLRLLVLLTPVFGELPSG